MVKVEEFQQKKSGWRLKEILNLNVLFYAPFSIGLSTFMRLPKFIGERRAVVNVENGDEYCFLLAIMAALHPVTNNGHKTSSYSHCSTEINY